MSTWTGFERRYHLMEVIGAGGMGVVFRARDRLGGVVALKRLAPDLRGARARSPGDDVTLAGRLLAPAVAAGPPSSTLGTAPTAPHLAVAAGSAPVQAPPTPMDDRRRLAFAREFHTLASVRHPSVISVLDYGFDERGEPFFTMELVEGATTILDAAREAAPERALALVEETLQALLYLHRRGIIHRDLKPANVLVAAGRVKVLDFGLAVLAERRSEHGLAGTPAYMAPELFLGAAPSQASDLYSLGVIAYEMLTGRRPYEVEEYPELAVLGERPAPDFSFLDPGRAAVLGRLLARDPARRYASATEAMAGLRAASGGPGAPETEATRESLLQAARLVDRQAELAHLGALLDEALGGRGSVSLVGGESGVGKSRLFEELRARALVRGVVVLRGQEVSEGGGPYQAWRDVLRWLVLLAAPSESEAGVLKPLVPDIAQLLDRFGGRPVEDAPAIDPDAALVRLLHVVEDLLRRLEQPIVVLLEDLHWMRSDGLKLLARLTAIAGELPVLVVGSYRDDERPGLPGELPGAGVLRLERLGIADIAALSESMVGPAGARPELVERLARETEGNPFFLVEVMRALAEEAGQLDRVGEVPLPASVSSRGMTSLIARRLSRVPEPASPLLAIAAVAGRQIDPAVMSSLAGGAPLHAWLETCVGAAVLDVNEGHHRFAHDKLREGLLAQLGDGERRSLHRRVAETIERVHPGSPIHTAALAHHFASAGEARKAARYAGLAGEQALQSSAYREAVGFFEQALALLPEDGDEAVASAAPATAAAPEDGDDATAAAAPGTAAGRGAATAPQTAAAPGTAAGRGAATAPQTAAAPGTAPADDRGGPTRDASGRSRPPGGGDARRATRTALARPSFPARPGARFLRQLLTGTHTVQPGGGELVPRARWEALLAEAHGRLGSHVESFRHAQAALRHLGLPVPPGRLAGVGSILGYVVRLALQSTRPSFFVEPSPAVRESLFEAMRVQTRLAETSYYIEQPIAMIWANLATLSHGAASGPSPDLARGYIGSAIVAGALRLHPLADRWSRRAVALAEGGDKPFELAWVLQRHGVYRMTVCEWAECERSVYRAIDIAVRSGDRRQWEESTGVLAHADAYRGRFAASLDGFAAVHASAGRRGDDQVVYWGAMGQVWCATRLGIVEDRIQVIEERRAWAESAATVSDVITFHGILGLARLHLGDPVRARESAEKVLAMIRAKAPMAYFTAQGISACAEVLLALWEEAPPTHGAERASLGRQARAACGCLTAFARIYPFCRPAAHLFAGLCEMLGGRPRRARASWQRALEEAARGDLSYERARAHLEIGRHAPLGSQEREEHLRSAVRTLQALRALPDLARAEEELGW